MTPVSEQVASTPASVDQIAASAGDPIARQFMSVRQQTERLCDPLTAEDMMVQSCAEASPAKWHIAHTTWFYETFILSQFSPDYRPFNADFVWLFNSYYNSVSEHPEKKLRASFSRPSLEAIFDYRRYVDSAVLKLLTHGGTDTEEVRSRVVLGVNHEQQHQELLITDIKHAFWTNPLHPVYAEGELRTGREDAAPIRWHGFEGGLRKIGFGGEGFSFDNERPRHQEYVEPFEMASRLTTCSEYFEFMQSGGYERSELWLSEGWDTVQAQGWRAPLYWRLDSNADEWSIFTLRGNVPLNEMRNTPVCHVSYFEADAFARWAGKTLPTEAEWETAAANVPAIGNLLESSAWHPLAAKPAIADEGTGDLCNQADTSQLFGDVWEWTRSPYVGYPRFAPLPGALGEYNGKFMCNQIVLRGGSVVTPASHIRATYRNFFSAATRWQFSGIRLTKTLSPAQR
ncbi:MAG TPA: ergothioneine biosynthesis protein EgtB [Acidisarcina sp.]